MKRIGNLFSAMCLALVLSLSAQAMLFDIGDGTVYDTATQLSWLKNANTAGAMTYSQAIAWAASLNIGGGYAGLTDGGFRRLLSQTRPAVHKMPSMATLFKALVLIALAVKWGTCTMFH